MKWHKIGGDSGISIPDFSLWDSFNSEFFYLQDTFLLETPGGGGYGVPGTRLSVSQRANKLFTEHGSVYEYRKAQESV